MFTRLNLQTKEYTFNPSIAHWKDNKYICAYRRFSRNRIDNNLSNDLNQIKNDSNHPWKGDLWWNSYGGYDNTGIAILNSVYRRTCIPTRYSIPTSSYPYKH